MSELLLPAIISLGVLGLIFGLGLSHTRDFDTLARLAQATAEAYMFSYPAQRSAVSNAARDQKSSVNNQG